MVSIAPGGAAVADSVAPVAAKPSAGTVARFIIVFNTDEVAALSVEGFNKSSIARVKQLAWNTVDRWLEKAARECHRFTDRRITGLKVTELQADEIRTMVGGKQQPIWIFVSIDVWCDSGLQLSSGDGAIETRSGCFEIFRPAWFIRVSL